jgi:hypothetical protein
MKILRVVSMGQQGIADERTRRDGDKISYSIKISP